MTVRAHCSRWMSAAVFSLAALCGAAQADGALDAVLAGEHRSEANRARDAYRHPAATLAFFGIEPGMTVVELWPGRGWYTEVLAPYLRENGKLYAAHFPAASTVEYYQKGLAAFKAMLAANPALYDRVVLTELGPPDSVAIAPAGSADAVLTFRNVHSWTGPGNDLKVMQAAFAALKPGGVLGVVEHRAAPGTSVEQAMGTGYMTEAMVIEAGRSRGLRARGEERDQRQPARHPRSPQGCVDAAALARAGRHGPREVPRDRRERPHDAALSQTGAMTALEIPWRELSADALQGVIEEFATREGTEYGLSEVPLATKVAQIRRQIERGEVLVFFDTLIESCQLLTREQAAQMRAAATTEPEA